MNNLHMVKMAFVLLIFPSLSFSTLTGQSFNQSERNGIYLRLNKEAMLFIDCLNSIISKKTSHIEKKWAEAQINNLFLDSSTNKIKVCRKNEPDNIFTIENYIKNGLPKQAESYDSLMLDETAENLIDSLVISPLTPTSIEAQFVVRQVYFGSGKQPYGDQTNKFIKALVEFHREPGILIITNVKFVDVTCDGIHRDYRDPSNPRG